MHLSEYPRPHFQRLAHTWQNLNGFWEYRIVEGTLDNKGDYQEIKRVLSGSNDRIRVPYSPETILSGVQKQVLPHQTLLLKLTFDVSIELNEVSKLHFGAVDQRCHVWLNDEYCGYHEDGYLPFSFEVSNVLKGKDNCLILSIIDESDQGDYPWGKQTLKRGQIWYTAQSGIWQTVWLESMPKEHIRKFNFTYVEPDQIEFKIDSDYPVMILIKEPTLDGMTDPQFHLKTRNVLIETHQLNLNLSNVKLWSSSEPWLYPIELHCGNDIVYSYFGCRSLQIKEGKDKIKRTYLNHHEIFQSGVLDQGYFKNGLYTPDSDQMLIDDIKTMKEMGFNTLRKHIKVECVRWYFHCDRLGMLVHQDMVNGGNHYNPMITQVLPFIGIHLNDKRYALFGRKSQLGRDISVTHQQSVIEHLDFFVSIVVWVISNEGWGQFDTLHLTQLARKQDLTRWIDHASGWHDQKGGDFNSPHVYYKKIRLKSDHRALILSEFGGYSFGVKGHLPEKPFGYRKYYDQQSYMDAVVQLYESEVLPNRNILSGCIYTQLSDVEDEINGLLTFDRQVIKWDIDTLKKLNNRLINPTSTE